MGLQTQINAYLQNLLSAQYDVSKDISHALTKGELREKFMKRLINDQFPNHLLKRGIIVCDEWQSPQTDLIWLRNNARAGDLNIYNIHSVNLIMEVKSNLAASELSDLNENAGVLKGHCAENENIRVGMFCYSSQAHKETVIKKFGFSYDRTLQSFNEYNQRLDLFPNIDFLLSLDIYNDNEPYFIIRGNARQDEGDDHPIRKNLLYLQNPVIDKFLLMFQ